MTETTGTFPPKLAKALSKARNAAAGVEKNGTADEGFEFVRSVDVEVEAQRLLKKCSLIVLPKGAKPTVQFGQSGAMVHVELLYEVVHSPSGESVVLSWAGSGFDCPGDKALYKALTGGRKYFLKDLLGIPFGIDPEEGATREADAPDEETPVESTVIDRSRASQICAGIGNSSLSSPDVMEMLTELGVEVEDGAGAGRVGDVVDAVKRLNPEQADQVEAHLERRAQDDAALTRDPESAGMA